MNRRKFCLALSALPAGMMCSSADAFPRLRRRRRRSESGENTAPAPPAYAFFEKFEAENWWKDNWGVGMVPTLTQRVDVATDISDSQKALHIDVPKGSNLGADFSRFLRVGEVMEPEEATFEYSIKFGKTFTGHGKLPGLVGTYGRGGWGGRKANGKNGWSARLGFNGNNHDFVNVSYYCYHMDQKQAWGDNIPWQKDGASYKLARDKWYTFRGTVKLNTVGQSDGEMRAWINDEPVVSQTGMRFREDPRLRIERFWFNIWHGGGKPAPVDMDLTVANVRVS